MKNFFYYLQYLLVRVLWLPIQCLPKRRMYGVGAALGWLVFWCGPRRRKIAVGNILGARVTADPLEARRIALRASMHFVGHLLEATQFQRVAHERDWHEFADHANLKNGAKELLESTATPVLILCPHLGVWEIATHVVSSFRPVTVIARTLNNPHIQRFLSGGVLRSNTEVIPKNKGLTQDVIRRWTREGRVLGIVCDQHAGKHGIWVDFMGRPAATFTSPARLHLTTGHPIIIGTFIRTGPYQYAMHGDTIRFTPTDDREADIRACTELINRHFATLIRLFPEQYLWSHRRWRQPPKTP